VATLDDPVRGRLHEAVRRAGRPLTREEAAEATGISRKLAAFHLEKLVSAGLLTASVEREGPRRVGRSPKVYAPVTRDLSVSVPVRTYDDLASILVDAAVTQPGSENARQARDQAATEAGKRLGEAVDRSATRGRSSAAAAAWVHFTDGPRVLDPRPAEGSRRGGAGAAARLLSAERATAARVFRPAGDARPGRATHGCAASSAALTPR